jgi:ATP-dependent exoDNAse (exonuclease V) beta subunit
MVETKGMYQYSNRYGIQLPYPEAVYAKPIFADLILNEEKEAILSEQVRLWYVALTRAKEKIILVMESSQPKPMVDLERMRSFADLMQWYDQQSGNVQPDNQWVTLPEQMPSLPQKGILDQHETITFKHQPQSFEVMTTDEQVN